MRIEKEDILWGAEQGIVSPEQATDLWDALVEKKVDEPRFTAVHVAYYFGAVLIMAAMGWLLNDAWDRLGAAALTIIASVYCLGFFLAGRWLWSSKELRIPGGLLLTVAVWMVPLVVFGVENLLGWWPGLDPGHYRGYFSWIKGGWFLMEVATVLAGLVVLHFFRFPFITFPIAFGLWFMSMDLAPLLFGVEDHVPRETRRLVSMVFGLVMLAGAYVVDRRTKEDFAFWGYLFGLMAFWGGAFHSGQRQRVKKVCVLPRKPGLGGVVGFVSAKDIFGFRFGGSLGVFEYPFL